MLMFTAIKFTMPSLLSNALKAKKKQRKKMIFFKKFKAWCPIALELSNITE